MTRIRIAAALALAAALTACKKEQPPGGLPGRAGRAARHHRVGPGRRRHPAGHDRRGEVEGVGRGASDAGETGQEVKQGDLLVRIDPAHPEQQPGPGPCRPERGPAHAANAAIAEARSDELFKSQSITPAGARDGLSSTYANAQADVIKSRMAVENAQIQANDATCARRSTARSSRRTFRARPLIQSATGNVSGGTAIAQDGRPQPGAGARAV